MHGIEYLNQPGYKGESWNVLYGCDGCELSRPKDNSTRCWAELQMPRQAQNLAKQDMLITDIISRGKWTGSVHLMPDRLPIPLHWRQPRMIAVEFMGDLFANEVPLEFIAAVQGVAAATPQHRYISLTKSVKRLEEYGQRIGGSVVRPGEWMRSGLATYDHQSQYPMSRWPDARVVYPLPNWIQGISATCQKTLEHRWRYLARFPARWRIISLTPKEAIDLRPLLEWSAMHPDEGDYEIVPGSVKPDLIILDCAAGPNAWPTDLEWIRLIIKQCRELGVGVRVKQAGSKPYEVMRVPNYDGTTGDLRFDLCMGDAAGGDPSEWPEDIRVRDWLEGF